MTRASGSPSDPGSAVIEFIVIGVAALVPMIYVVQCVLVMHSAVLASTQATREAARAFSVSATPADGRNRAVAAARLAFRDQGIELPAGALRVGCVDGPCLSPGSAVVVDVDWRVPLPWVPESWAGGAAIPVTSSQRMPIDDFRSTQD